MSKRIGLAAIAVAVPAALVFTGVGLGQAPEHTAPSADTRARHSATKAVAASGLDDPAKKEKGMDRHEAGLQRRELLARLTRPVRVHRGHR